MRFAEHGTWLVKSPDELSQNITGGGESVLGEWLSRWKWKPGFSSPRNDAAAASFVCHNAPGRVETT
jgi:hypothetical protein